LQERERLQDGWIADSCALHLGRELFDDLRGEVPELQAADPGKDVTVEDRGVQLEGLGGEVRLRVEPKPLAREIGERLPSRVHHPHLSEPLHAPHLDIERVGVAAPVKLLAAAQPAVGPPADTPGRLAVAKQAFLHAH